ncbi:hypothetical protein CDL12_04258 [Handroanthus impetiginosus]|uniref:PGG domain-containing protein n=1 Tax=Handroanthus impetiginosus TaxID=429701 RepID=A0A2G9HZU7_9LAMI|nr:hypothetical protein CDL12_04258 [Handroanthus impetiginosus]
MTFIDSLYYKLVGPKLRKMKGILEARPDYAWKRSFRGCTPLHIACSKGQLEITGELIKLDSDLCLIQDYEGRLESAEMTTFNGETIVHLAVKNNQYEVVKYLTESINISKLLNMQDNDENTILHLATAGKLTTMVTHLLKMGTEVNSLNRKGYTAPDVIEAKASNSSALAIKLDLQNEGLRNARETVTIVAVLIANVTFVAGMNPPGGFGQDTGKATRANRVSFKVFLLCNIVSLFLSIGVVNVLVSIIPFTRKTMMKLLSVTHKVMWLSTLFMAAANYIAAIWTPCLKRRGQWHNKYKWRKVRQKKMKEGSPGSSTSHVDELRMMKKDQDASSNSDVDSSDHGYHLY